MNDGIEETKRESEQHQFLQRAHPVDYTRAVLKMAVAQICEGVGFDFVKKSALEGFSDVAMRYISDLGKSASLYASLAGRSEVNVFDMVKGLEDLGSDSGFLGCSEVDDCVGGFGVVKEMVDFVETMEEIPFSQPIPRFPVIKLRKGIPSFSQMGEVPSGKHIPDWLPAFPDPHTYMHTPIWNERNSASRIDKVELVRQRRKAEKSLLSLQQRLISNGLAGPSGSWHFHVEAETGLVGAATDSNPFLDPPLQPDEKDVSTVAVPAKVASKEGDKKHVSVFETFSPAIEAIKGGGVSDPMDLDARVTTERRHVVHFRLKAGKKMLVEDLDVNLRNRSRERRASWLGRDDDKDDKKRRAELILRQSMERENPQELSQL